MTFQEVVEWYQNAGVAAFIGAWMALSASLGVVRFLLTRFLRGL